MVTQLRRRRPMCDKAPISNEYARGAQKPFHLSILSTERRGQNGVSLPLFGGGTALPSAERGPESCLPRATAFSASTTIPVTKRGLAALSSRGQK